MSNIAKRVKTYGIKQHNIDDMTKYHNKYISNKEDDELMDIFTNLYDQKAFASEEERQRAYFDFSAGYVVCHMLFNHTFKG